ncbi:MAG TPA: nucleotidyltransferase family protein [Candidatus Angelobacter sp.]|nr:nucleotidyltransferase family protein [Candidatus Angelobacter sp.]
MKAFLLAAGKGERLRPLTEDVPKCLLPIQGTPLLALWLENCRRAGINEVLINAHAHAAMVRDFVSRQERRISITVAEEAVLLGSAGTLAMNRAFVENEETFYVLYADVLSNVTLPDMLAAHEETQSLATLGVYQVPDPQRCGVITFDSERIVRSFVEKPAQPKSKWAFSGIMIARPEIIDLVPPQRPADIGFHLLPQLVGGMAAYPMDGFLMDIGTPENYQAAQSLWPGFGQAVMKGDACCKA